MSRHRQQSWGIWEVVSPCCAAGNFCDCHLQVKCGSGAGSSQLGSQLRVSAGGCWPDWWRGWSGTVCCILFLFLVFVDDEAGPGLDFVSLAGHHAHLS